MRWLIALLIGVLAISDLRDWDLSLAPGMSVKNAGLYLIAMALLFRSVLSGGKTLYLPGLHVLFGVLIGYAALSVIAAVFVMEYPRYDLRDSVIALKSRLVDPALFLFAVFYGLKDFRETRWAMGVLLFALGAVNLLTLTDLSGITHMGTQMGTGGAEAGRVFGAFGHANDTAALIVCVLPAMIAGAISSRGLARLAWWVCALASLTVFIATVSRGAYVGLIVGSLIGAFLCRRYLPLSKVFAGAFVAVGIVTAAVVIAVIADPQIGGVLTDRVFGTARSMDGFEASSGRTGIWADALGQMLRSPLSLLTGFGWNAYSAMPLHFAPHNHYLGVYFELGLIGLAAFVLIQRYTILTALRAVASAEGVMAHHLLAFVFGMLCLSVTIFFADLFKPWPYIWMYVGMVMRAVVDLRETRAAESEVPALPPLQAFPGRFGRPIGATRVLRT
jgi:O-antigen ligase